MSELPVYETWLERNGHIEDVVTDAPGGMRLVSADDYDKLQDERDRLREGHRLIRGLAERVRDNAGNSNLVRVKAGNIISWIDINAALQEAGDE